MARQSSALSVALLALLAASLAASRFRALLFMAPSPATPPRVQMRYQSGKVNVGAEIGVEMPRPPQPVLDCDEDCITAIYDCIEEGCSVDALLKLDSKLAEDEAKIVATVAHLQEQQKLNFSEEAKGELAWLGNFLNRSSSLRAQLLSIRSAGGDSDFVSQMMKAAAVAFGGGKKGDYPKVGVASYSA